MAISVRKVNDFETTGIELNGVMVAGIPGIDES